MKQEQRLTFENPITMCLLENPALVEFMMFRFKTEYIKELEPYILRDWIIPCGAYKGVKISDIEPITIRYLIQIGEFKYRHPMIDYSMRYFIKNKRLTM